MIYNQLQPTAKAVQRFWNKVDKTNECWNWTGAAHERGYGLFWLNGSMRRAHRVSYIMTHGAIAEGLVIDHLCKNTACVKPDHLEAVTQHENTLRGDVRNQAGLCRNGLHPWVESNIYTYPDGRSTCRDCARAASRRFYARAGESS